MGDGQDTEITLGAGKLLFIFFGLVVLCAIFFGVGYMMGKGTNAQTAASANNIPNPATSDTAKPSADKGTGTVATDCPAGQNCAGSSSELTFYKAVEQQTPDTQTPTAQASPTAAPPPASTPPTKQTAPPETAHPIASMSVPNGTGYVVQVAAVSKQQDAEALAYALRRKNYTAVVNNPGDNLFHVQVGPFMDFKQADAMRARLQADGYSPIVKK